MARGEQRSNREKKKPKKDKNVASAAGATTLTGVLLQREAQKTGKSGKRS